MAVIGTKKFWRPAAGASATQKENQVLKNQGYINLQLYSVNYMSKGNVFQKIFGGKDTIALSTNLKYQSGVDSIEATAVQDIREVRSNRNYILGIQRYIAVKIPAVADAISIEVKMTSVSNDMLQAKLDMLNKPEFQSALQLAPVIVGQVLTITSLAKKLFSDTDPHSQLEASYAGVISAEQQDNPVPGGKLTRGQLIMISTDDGDPFENVDEKKFEVRGDALYYNNEQVENTYIIFTISVESLKGEDERSKWFRKFSEALNNLDKIQLTTDQTDITRIFNDSKTLWIEGNALIDADETYINSEKIKIKAAAIKSINDKYNELARPLSHSLENKTFTADIVKELIDSTEPEALKKNFPGIDQYMNDKTVPKKEELYKEGTVKTIGVMLEQDARDYQEELKRREVAASISALGDVISKGGSYETFYRDRKESVTISEQARLLRNTFDDDELDDIKKRIHNCRDRFKTESGEARARCFCRVLKDVKDGNGGYIPDPEWQSIYDQLKCAN